MKIEIRDENGKTVHSHDLEDGEYTLVVGEKSHVYRDKFKTFVSLKDHKEEKLTATAILMVYTIFVISDYLIFDAWATDFAKYFSSIIASFFKLLAVSMFLAFVFKVTTNHFRIFRAVSYIFGAWAIHLIWDSHLFGYRFLMPSIFEYNWAYVLILYISGAAVLYFCLKDILPNLKPKLLKTSTVVLLSFFVFYKFSPFLPMGKSYYTFNLVPPPPRASILESKPVSTQEFLNQIDEL